MSSKAPANHENGITPVPAAPGKESLKTLQRGRKWTAKMPRPSAMPTIAAATGA